MTTGPPKVPSDDAGTISGAEVGDDVLSDLIALGEGACCDEQVAAATTSTHLGWALVMSIALERGLVCVDEVHRRGEPGIGGQPDPGCGVHSPGLAVLTHLGGLLFEPTATRACCADLDRRRRGALGR